MTRSRSKTPPPPWRPARVVANEPMADGSMWLTLECADGDKPGYAPGHVVSVALVDDEGSIHRHAYTVSSGDAGMGRFSHLYRVIREGRLTPRLARLDTGDAVWFHGPFHTPIADEVDPTARRIVGVATGTGIGPLHGFAEKALAEGENRPIALFASFRKRDDVVFADRARWLSGRHAHFNFEYSLTDPPGSWKGHVGRVQDFVPARLESLGATHLHLVGRGDMVHLWRRAWLHAGLPERRVSVETYFNHHEEPETADIERLASRLKKGM